MLKNKQNTSYEGDFIDLSSKMKNLKVNKIKKTKSFEEWLKELKCNDCKMMDFQK
jgi:ASC-1-like (ASCH) protein